MGRAVWLVSVACFVASANPRVALIADDGLDAPARHGLSRLEQSLTARGFEVIRTSRTAPAQADYYVTAEMTRGGPPESLVIERTTFAAKPAVALRGADATGLMYAALDTAERIALGHDPLDPFSAVRPARESPELRDRAVSMYTMQRAWFEQRLHDPKHWEKYFDLLAASRLNSFVVIFGYENGGFMAPLYPFFFDVEQYPDVRLVGITAVEQQRNVAAFHRLMQIAHDRGIRVTAAIWDHIYRGGVQGGGIEGASTVSGQPVPGLVWGLTSDNLSAYTQAALTKFLDTFPEIDALQFRMHGESGLKESEMAGFRHEVFVMIRDKHPGMPVELRAKELPDSIIADAQAQGLHARVSTKYWMEQMGLPFHPTHVNQQNQHDRRHGYADLLRYPQTYKVHFQLWSGGTTRLLLWADPDYVRRFIASVKIYGGDSFDVNEMLATKMLGEPHDATPLPIHTAAYRNYEYEFERYWHFYQLWGRLSYNPAASPDLWEMEFQRRFGPAGPHLMAGLHTASHVLPRIVAASYPYNFFPTTRGWAEMMRLGDLPKYAQEHVTDTAQFMSARDRARQLLTGTADARRTPEDTSRWFAQTSSRILAHVAKAERVAGAAPPKEFITTVTDLKILAQLASYHSERLLAAVEYSLVEQAGPAAAFDEALRHERNAIAAWERMVQAAGNVYSGTLAFGVHRVGFPKHWNEELENLRRGLNQLEASRSTILAKSGTQLPKPPRPVASMPTVQLPAPGIATPGQSLTIAARVTGPVGTLRLRYRHFTQYEDYVTAEMNRTPKPDMFQASIPGDFITPQWDLIYYVEVIDGAGNGRVYPDLDKETPYRIVGVRR